MVSDTWTYPVTVGHQVPFTTLDGEAIGSLVRAVLQSEGAPTGREVLVIFVDDEAIRALNQEFRGIDQATDVLSFPNEGDSEDTGDNFDDDGTDFESEDNVDFGDEQQSAVQVGLHAAVLAGMRNQPQGVYDIDTLDDESANDQLGDAFDDEGDDEFGGDDSDAGNGPSFYSLPSALPGAFVLPPGTTEPLGEIVVSVPTATRQAAEHGRTLAHEVAHLIVHGALHLLGYDHAESVEERDMRAREDRALEACRFPPGTAGWDHPAGH